MAILRYFAATDEISDIGALALSYADTFAELGMRFRIIAADGGGVRLDPERLADGTLREVSRWAKHRDHFATPVIGPYVNAVCTHPKGWLYLYTVGVRNVLLLGVAPPAAAKLASASVEKIAAIVRPYEAVIVPTPEIATAWERHGSHPVVVPISLPDNARRVREALFGP